jgi:hypothetical protein
MFQKVSGVKKIIVTNDFVFLTYFAKNFFLLVGELSELLSCWQDGLALAIKFCNVNWFFHNNK